MNIVKTKNGADYLVSFILVTSLFFLWGFAHSILDVLNKHFQDVLVISKARSGLVQVMVYGGYFLMALPAGWIIRKWSYRTGVVVGLLLYGIGALMFIPGGKIMSFPFFLLCLFVIGCGLTCLETSANPYITVLGEKDSAARRLNLAQSFNGLGWIFGPMIGGLMILGDKSNISLPYAVIGGITLILGVVFSRIKLPEIGTEATSDTFNNNTTEELPLSRNGLFIFGVVTLFLYVAAQTGINSFFINYVIETTLFISSQDAAFILSFGGMGLFMIGRFLGSWLMKFVQPSIMLLWCALGAVLCMGVVIANFGLFSVVALCLCLFFESIMFPTIFSLSIRKTGSHTKTASSILIMSIVGGAVSPPIMGLIGEKDMSIGFVIPLLCFIGIVAYAFKISSHIKVEKKV